ncbi:hypothetical protein [Hymenobacter psychrophilus]|uniref:hypothetical protein n=1 Tax=Hymenobacter psychrophilus TaxID=651662 RepID=UPI0015871A01|nr:hypothetical protein [Hymenobacter psychrophilus]
MADTQPDWLWGSDGVFATPVPVCANTGQKPPLKNLNFLIKPTANFSIVKVNCFIFSNI